MTVSRFSQLPLNPPKVGCTSLRREKRYMSSRRAIQVTTVGCGHGHGHREPVAERWVTIDDLVGGGCHVTQKREGHTTPCGVIQVAAIGPGVGVDTEVATVRWGVDNLVEGPGLTR